MKASPPTIRQQLNLNLLLLFAIFTLIVGSVLCRLSLFAFDGQADARADSIGKWVAVMGIWASPITAAAAIWQIGLQMRAVREYSIRGPAQLLITAFVFAFGGIIVGATVETWPFL